MQGALCSGGECILGENEGLVGKPVNRFGM